MLSHHVRTAPVEVWLKCFDLKLITGSVRFCHVLCVQVVLRSCILQTNCSDSPCNIWWVSKPSVVYCSTLRWSRVNFGRKHSGVKRGAEFVSQDKTGEPSHSRLWPTNRLVSAIVFHNLLKFSASCNIRQIVLHLYSLISVIIILLSDFT